MAEDPRTVMQSPPFDRYLVTLCMTRPAGFHFNHGGALNGLLCAAYAQHPLPEGVALFACESGRVRFEAGERYNFGLTLIGEARRLGAALHEGLARLGRTEPDRSQPLPALLGNFEVEMIAALPPPDLDAELAALAGEAAGITLQFVSPLRIPRPPGERTAAASYLNAECFPVPQFLSRVWGRTFRLANGRSASEQERSTLRPPLPVSATIVEPRLTWLTLPVGDADRDDRPGGLTLGGVLGRATLVGVPEVWLPYLILGSYTHVGENTRFGFGRYRLAGADRSADPFRPATTLLECLADPARLSEALDHVARHSDAPGVDGVAAAHLAAARGEVIGALAADLAGGRYRPQPLRGIVIPKDGGKVRALAVPTVRDRIAQRSACELLAPAIDRLLEDCSFAYRKGRSRASAALAIQRAYDEGFRWVLDADIEAFFDHVDWDRLEAKLDGLYPGEPLIELLRAWVRQPVEFEGTLIQRERGLPQGAAISPLLANLYLDELDEDLLQQGFRVVRYADDVLVLCRDLDAVRAAQDEVKGALVRLGLTLNVDKTVVRSFDQGFSYLGYLFCRSLVLDQPKGHATVLPLQAEAVPAASWLAAVPLDDVRDALAAAAARRSRPEQARPLAPLTLAAPLRRALYIVDPAAEIELRQEKLFISSPTRGNEEVPIRTLSHVVFLGRVRATVPVLLGLSRLGVPSYFCRRSGALYSVFSPHAPDWPLWQAQALLKADAGACLAFVRAVVAAKLHNTATIATRFKLQDCGSLGEALRALEQSCLQQSNVAGLRGLEGKGAALFFGALKESLSPDWRFPGRRKHPAEDPVNAALSLAYTVVYNHVSTALLAAGLNPRIGLFHEERGAYHALASDLQEELRHLAEAHVIGMIRRRELTPEDFAPSDDGNYPCLLSVDARRTFLRALERRLLTTFTPPDRDEATTYLAFINHQAAVVKALVQRRVEAYAPLRIHA